MYFSNSKYWDLGAPIAGILLALSFAPFNYIYLALLSLIFLFASWQNVSPGRALLRGYLFGLGLFGLGVSWVYISIHDFGGADLLSSIILTSLFIIVWALFPALCGYLSVKLMPPNVNLLQLLAIPFIWVLIEYVRGYLVLNGFPWLQVAYSQLEAPLAGYIPIVGGYGTSFLLAFTASSFVILMFYKKHLVILTAIIAVLWSMGSWLQAVKWTQDVGNPIKASLIQGNISQDQKWKLENRNRILQKYKAMTEEHWDSDVIVWPETAVPAFLSEVNESFLLPLRMEAAKNGTDLIISIPIKENLRHEKYNAAITLGKNDGIYRKSHLLPFGEYLPLQPLSGFMLSILDIPLAHFLPGRTDQPLLKAGGYTFITSICYEDAFSDVNIRGLPEAAYLVNVTNDAWFGDSLEPHQHMQIARMRAMETGRFLLRATNTGITAIVSPQGKIINQAPLFETTVISGTIIPMGGMTPYARLGDRVIIGVIGILFLALIVYGNTCQKVARENLL
jgi:apolipoprotein N-acyltransferase